MALNISSIIETKVMTLIRDNPDIEFFMSDLFPNFREKFTNSEFTVSELEDLHCQLDNYHSTLYHNLVISIRLAGGIEIFSEKLNVELEYVNEVLRSNCRKTQLLCAKKVIDSQIVQSDFFDSSRIFFPQNFITDFRQKNLASVFSLAHDYRAMFEKVLQILSEKTPSLDHVLPFISDGKYHELSAQACRSIESELGLPNGIMDDRPRNFFKAAYDSLS